VFFLPRLDGPFLNLLWACKEEKCKHIVKTPTNAKGVEGGCNEHGRIYCSQETLHHIEDLTSNPISLSHRLRPARPARDSVLVVAVMETTAVPMLILQPSQERHPVKGL